VCISKSAGAAFNVFCRIVCPSSGERRELVTGKSHAVTILPKVPPTLERVPNKEKKIMAFGDSTFG